MLLRFNPLKRLKISEIILFKKFNNDNNLRKDYSEK